MRPLLLVLFTCLNSFCHAQQKVIDVDRQEVTVTPNVFYTIAGSPVSTAKYVRLVSGSPYFRDHWMNGTLETADGQLYSDIKLKLDLTDNSVLFLSRDSVEMMATASIKKITLKDPLTGTDYEFIYSSFITGLGSIETGWYHVLVTGPKAFMYKRILKKMDEIKPYGSATTELNISTTNKYFLGFDSRFIQVKKFRDLPDLLPDKKEDLNKYLASLKLNGKSDGDYVELVKYYNDITAK
jgi:hypothetical protein